MGGGGSNLRINQFNERRTRSFVVPRAERRQKIAVERNDFRYEASRKVVSGFGKLLRELGEERCGKHL